MLRPVRTTLISARDLDDVNPFFEIKPYPIVWIHGSQSYNMILCPEDTENGINPNWNHPITFMVEEAALRQGRLKLVVEIRARGNFGNIEIGRVYVPIPGNLAPGEEQYGAYELYKPSGVRKGTLNMSVKIEETTDASQTMQRPAPGHSGFPPYWPWPSSVYPPPPYETFYIPQPPGSWNPPLTAHGVPYHPQFQGDTPQGYPSQGYPTQNQGCSLLQECFVKFAVGILTQCIVADFGDLAGFN